MRPIHHLIFALLQYLDQNHVRKSTLADVQQTTRLLDAMENVDLVYASLVDATDLLPHMTMPASFAAVIANTTKPLIGPGVTNRAEAQVVVDLARATRGNDEHQLTRYPPCIPFITPISPLTFPNERVQAIEVIARAGLPLDVVSNPVMGLTSPNTIAGTVVMGQAEVLATAVIAHAVYPGLPILNHNTPSVADMRTLLSTTGGPETGMIRHTVAALSRKIGIPACVHGHSSSTFSDFQGGVEKTVNLLLIAQGEPAVLGGLGVTGNVTLASYEAILLDNDIYGAIKRIRSGVTVDGDHLAVDVIAEVVQAGDFISSDHTIEHLNSGEVWQPALAIREGLRGGAQPDRLMADNARQKARELLTSYQTDPLEERIQSEMDVILLEYQKSLGN